MKKNTGFDPIKEETDGKKAKSVIWSTKALELAMKGLEQGRKLIANPFYENNIKLLKGDLVFQRTPEEIEEWKTCRNDIIYWATEYAKLMTPEGIKNVKLRDYQERYLRHVSESQLSVYLAARQVGKCLIFNELVKIKINWSNLSEKISVDRSKKYWDKYYYIIEEDCYEVPLFEIYNLYDKSLKWKIKYQLYKLLYKLSK